MFNYPSNYFPANSEQAKRKGMQAKKKIHKWSKYIRSNHGEEAILILRNASMPL